MDTTDLDQRNEMTILCHLRRKIIFRSSSLGVPENRNSPAKLVFPEGPPDFNILSRFDILLEEFPDSMALRRAYRAVLQLHVTFLLQKTADLKGLIQIIIHVIQVKRSGFQER